MGERDTRATDWIDPIPGGSTNDAALTASSAKAPAAEPPVSDATAGRFVVDLRAPAGTEGDANRAVHYDVAFALQDAADETAVFRVWGWRPVGTTWVPRLLLAGTMTAGARVGVASTTLDNTWFLADTIAVTEDNTRGASAQVDTSADADGQAVLSFDADGAAVIEVEVSRDSGTAAAVRALIAGK